MATFREPKRSKGMGQRAAAASLASTKLCSRCGVVRPRSQFTSRPAERSSDGLDHWCRSCHAEAAREKRASARGREHARKVEALRREFSELPLAPADMDAIASAAERWGKSGPSFSDVLEAHYGPVMPRGLMSAACSAAKNPEAFEIVRRELAQERSA